MDPREIVAAARRIREEAASIAAADQLLTGQAMQITRLAEWIEELAAISSGEVPAVRRSSARDIAG
jgi:hypothetical protein